MYDKDFQHKIHLQLNHVLVNYLDFLDELNHESKLNNYLSNISFIFILVHYIFHNKIREYNMENLFPLFYLVIVEINNLSNVVLYQDVLHDNFHPYETINICIYSNLLTEKKTIKTYNSSTFCANHRMCFTTTCLSICKTSCNISKYIYSIIIQCMLKYPTHQ